MIKIVHCADIHIGASFGRLPSALSSMREKEQREAFRDMIDFCKEKNIDALLICGDLFDRPKPLKKDLDFVRNFLSDISPIPVYIIAGNHDYITNDSPYSQSDCFTDNVHIFPTFDYSFEICEKNTVIYGKSYSRPVTEATFDNILPDKNKINIICVHGDVNSSSDYNPVRRETLSSLPLNYAAFGHIHNREFFKIGNTDCAYCGILDGTGFDDDGDTGIVYGEITPEKTTLYPISFSKRKYHNISFDVSSEDTEKIIQEISKNICKEDLYRITLYGETTDGINTEVIKEEIGKLCFYAEIIDKTILSYDFDSIENEDSLRGEFLREVRKLTSSEEEFIHCGKTGLDALMGIIPSTEVDV